MFHGLSDGAGSQDDAELQRDSRRVGCTPIASHVDRDVVTLHGSLSCVTLRPRGGVLALEADLYDGSGTVTLVWLGRRQIAGIAPGRALTVRGRLGCTDGRRVLFNPRYELAA
ncbi:MAG: OB-fold nucleic acid binding domain-containing protein [Nocardioidaceae bacterium]|nr:OB-fold nucleic acid binding domain-containing protein [Nocardioidaceae bacterium]